MVECSIIPAYLPNNLKCFFMTKPAQFEKSIQALEQVVAALEKGDVSLDDALKQFEKGIQLTRACQTLLTEAEQKVETLMKSSNAKEDDKDA